MRIPVSTYRLQLRPDFGFQKVKGILPYLHELGISDVYISPFFKARRGSPHGYDVVDMNQLNPDLGTEDDFEELVKELKKYRIGWIQDVVPNHMAFDGENRILMDILENGRNSEYRDFFDITWDHFSESMSERLLAPFLGRHYSDSLDAKEITIQYRESGFSIHYYSLRLALKIESYVDVITHRLDALQQTLGDEDPDLIKLMGITYALKNLPAAGEEREERKSQVQFVKRMLWELYSSNREIKQFLDENLEIFNGEKDGGGDMNLLDKLLAKQSFRLSFWKVATEELNFRRFFNINGLISLRMEDEKVFEKTHELVFRLLKEYKISGLRIDHIDGLYDPSDYLRKLREAADDTLIIVEKILGPDERLHPLWAVQGTTGYDFLNCVNGIFCDESNGKAFNKLYYKFSGMKMSFEAFLYEKRKLVIETDMTGDVDNLAHFLKNISSRDRYGVDITLYGIKRGIIEILAFFPVYRTYIRFDHYSEADRTYMREAVEKAREANPALLYEINFIERFLFLTFDEHVSKEEREGWTRFVMRFQQFTGPLMAKGLEDTTMYLYNRLLSLNEVGGSPDRFGISPAAFHEFNLEHSRRQPHSMNATSTHDTKRGEDARARINVLSEMPELWESTLKRWSSLNRRKKRSIKGGPVPDRNDEYFLYQTLIGAFPFKDDEFESFKSRLKEYIVKAVREAKIHTAWLKPDIDYEENFTAFIDRILSPSDKNLFPGELAAFQKMISHYGIFNSLSQTLVKITSPGFPDFFQGTEFWDLSFVDPDNRRPVDFELREWLFREMRAKEESNSLDLVRELLSTKEDGRIKLFLIYKALAVRSMSRNAFENGKYIPLTVKGKYKESVIAYAFAHKPLWIVTIVPRFLTGMIRHEQLPLGPDVWDDTHILLPDGAPSLWREELCGMPVDASQSINAGEAFGHFPCALLTGGSGKNKG